jgi:outer membrane protein insertion porin family
MEAVYALKRRGVRARGLGIFLATGWLIVVLAAGAAESSTNEPAKVKVSGFGFLGNREMIHLLRNFQVSGEFPPVIDRAFVEDAALVLFARALDDGYLRASLQSDFRLLDGTRQRLGWTNVMEVELPREFTARWARFKLNRCVRYYYADVRFAGLSSIPEREARGYFIGSDMLLKLRGNRVFSPRALESSLAALQDAYARAGFQNAVVTTNRIVQDDKTGEVTVEIGVQEGLPTVVRLVEVTMEATDSGASPDSRWLTPGKPFSKLWQQELGHALEAEQYSKGYPDATVEFSEIKRETNAANIQIDLAAHVKPGPLVRLGKVIFTGNRRTKPVVLESRVKLKEGEPLNRAEAEASRQRMARLGVFSAVNLKSQATGDDTRDVIYEFQEIKPVSLSVLGGFGSYELLRGGLEFQHRNFLGRAHNLRMRGMQSFKASQGDLLYTVPDVFGENVNLFGQGAGLRREEVSFTREEFGGSVGLQKRLVPIKTDFSLRYNYEFLNASDISATSTNSTGVQDAKAAAFIIELNRDRRDHPLLPRRGLKFFSRVEFASAALGGTVDYQRLLLGASYHRDLHGGRLLHLGVTHGMSFTLGGDANDLPFNKRFFPGGENSIRGYQDGEAAPVDANGAQLGAETFTQVNVELEQLLTKSWSIVAFVDSVGFAQDRDNYPWDEELYSVGGGLRWRTLIGPVRLEYGHNLKPRVHDPRGTLHFSVGFPF